MKSEINVFIIDDSIFISEELVEKSIYEAKIEQDVLKYLVENFEWKGQHNLKSLTSKILNSIECQNGKIKVFGFTHPSICLDEIDKGVNPDVIIYDWEYNGESNQKSSEWLIDILKFTDAFVFVYSQVRDSIPPFLNKSEFDSFSSKFQLFLKGDTENSIFSSEEFILQYILTRVTLTPIIFVGGKEVSFLENGYLSKPDDILYVENIIGKQNLLSKLNNIDSLKDEAIEQIFEDNELYFLYDETKNYLIASDANYFIDKFNPSKKIRLIDVIKQFGIKKLNSVLESGITKITPLENVDN